MALAAQVGRPAGPLAFGMDQLFERALVADHPLCVDHFTGPAMWLLYIRSHYLRMPFHLLIPHLLHKAFISPINARRDEKNAENRPTIEGLIAENKAK